MANSVIIPLDGSKLAEQALRLGISVAQQMDSAVQLVQVVSMPSSSFSSISTPDGEFTPVDILEINRIGAQNYLSEMKTKLEEASIAVETSVIEGEVGRALADFANQEEAAYLVMSTHGRSGLSRWTVGSVADQVLHLSERPLIIMRPQEVSDASLAELVEPQAWLSSHLPEPKRIVVPLDGSSFAEQILPHVKKLARAYGADLFLFCAVSFTPPGLIGADVAILDNRLYDINRHQARDYLDRIKLNLEAEGFKVSIKIGSMPITDAILDYAANSKADLIAMTTHARGAIGRFIMGSVADGVIRAGLVPVLVTRAETKES